MTLTHANLAANIKCIMHDGLRMRPGATSASRGCRSTTTWGSSASCSRPLYHRVADRLLPALLFLKRPVTWFQAITRHKGTIAYAPNFAYALCVKRIKPTELEGLDLSTWRVAGCGAEPIRPETLEGFADAFARIGFRKEALLPSYGMAESSLAISFTELGEGMKTISVDGPTLWEKGEAELVAGGRRGRACGSCRAGPSSPSTRSACSTRTTRRASARCPRASVGELRIAGPSVMRGYWEDAERTRDVLRGPVPQDRAISASSTSGHVFICGRSKEVVIVNGRNYYPQDMEWEASKVAGVRKGNVVAFGARDPSGIERDRERVVARVRGAGARAARRRPPTLLAEVRKAVQEGHGPDARRRGRAAAGRPAEDVERQAAAREDARALRDGRADGPFAARAT